MLTHVSRNVDCHVITYMTENIHSVFHVTVCTMKYVNKLKNMTCH